MIGRFLGRSTTCHRRTDENHFWLLRRIVAPGLFAGLMLDSVARLGYSPHRAVLGVLALLAMVMWRWTFPLDTRSLRGISLSTVVALTVSVLLASADIFRVSEQTGGLRSVFASRSLFHEDNSAWIALGTFSSENGVPSGKFGYQLSILHSTTHALATLIGWLSNLPFGAWGVAVSAVTIGYIAMVAVLPLLVLPTYRSVLRKTESFPLAAFTSGFFLLFLLGFVREVRYLGHYSAGVAVLLGVASVNFLVSRGGQAERFSREQLEAILTFALALNLWFPLQPLSFIVALFPFVAFRSSGRRLSDLNLSDVLRYMVLVAPFVLLFVTRYARSILPSNEEGSGLQRLLTLPGATYETYSALLILLSGLVLLAMFTSTERPSCALQLGVLSLFYGIAIRFADAAAGLGFDYGSTKLIWVLIPPLSVLFFLTFLSQTELHVVKNLRMQIGGVVMFSVILLLNSATFFHSIRQFHPFLPIRDSSVFLEAEDEEVLSDSPYTWDTVAGLSASLLPVELPLACVTTTDWSPVPQWGFEPYRCTRKVAEASLQQGIVRESDGQSVDVLLRRFPLLQASLTETVMGIVSSGNDLSRDILILDEAGQMRRTERIIDYLVQVSNFRPLLVKATSSALVSDIDSRRSTLILGSIDLIDQQSGKISGWVSPMVRSLLLVGDAEYDDVSVNRDARADVAAAFGAGNLYSGFALTSLGINSGLQCVVAQLDNGETRVLWSAGEEASC